MLGSRSIADIRYNDGLPAVITSVEDERLKTLSNIAQIGRTDRNKETGPAHEAMNNIYINGIGSYMSRIS